MNDVFDLFGDLCSPEPSPTPPTHSARKSRAKPRVPTVIESDPVAEPDPPPAVEPGPEPADYGPRFLDCGHLNWYSDADNEVARAEGHCCVGGKRKIVSSLLYRKGEYVRPFPTSMRRSPERERGMGFPGYCCDADGWYIGGIGNDCRYDSPDERRCAVHGAPPPPIVYDDDEPEPEPEPVASHPPPPLTGSKGGSWKQRQMSAKRGRR